MFVVTVSIAVKPEAFPAFLLAMKRQAATTLEREPDCLQFDVSRGDDGAIFLYEVYRNQAAFEAHCGTDYFQAFERGVRELIDDKTIATYTRYEI